MKLFYNYMKINKKIFTVALVFMLMPLGDIQAAGTKITAAQAFYTLAHYNNTGRINALRNKGYSIESVNAQGYNPVCIAILRQDKQAYRTLVSQGANRSPACIKKIPESTYRRFFGISANQTAIKNTTPKYEKGLGFDIPTWIAAGTLGAGAIATAYALRGETGGSDSPYVPTTCKNGKYDSKTKVCTCNEGYNHYGDENNCYAPIPNCEEQKAGKCNACIANYHLYRNACYAPIANCTIQTGEKCAQCAKGYGIHGGDGTACYNDIEHCTTQYLNTCTKCDSGYGTYGDESKMQCYKKIDHCLIQVQTACTQCETGYDTYGDPTHCYASNPCSSYDNTVPKIVDDEITCVCNANKGYTGDKENCVQTEEGDYQEGDGNQDEWSNVNELYCNSHGKYLGNGICQCYTSIGYTGTNSNCTVEECCTSCVEPTYIKDESNGLCYLNLYCTDHKRQVGNSCVCEEGYIEYHESCYEQLQCEINQMQKGNECVCKPNYDENCEECLAGYEKDEYGNCVEIAPICPEKWQGKNCDICPVQYLLSSDGLHCGPECAVNRKPVEENPDCQLCQEGYDLDSKGLCVVTECSSGVDGYIKDEDGNCVCDTANGYAMTRLGICEKKGEDIIGIKDTNINNSTVTLTNDGSNEDKMHDVYGMKPVESEDENNKKYYDSVYNALASGGGSQTATITINNMNTGANNVFGIYQPNSIYNAAVINRTTNNSTADGTITINDMSTLSEIYGLYNTTEVGQEGEVSKSVYNAFAFGSGQGTDASPTINQATGTIKITKDEYGSGDIIGIHGVDNIANAYANTSDGIAAGVTALGNIILKNDGEGKAIGIEGTNSSARVNNALSYLNSAVSNAISTGTIDITTADGNAYGILAQGSVANSETQFSKSYSLIKDFSSTGLINVTVNRSNSKAYGIYIKGSNVKADLYNALGFRSTGTVNVKNTDGGSAYGLWNEIATYVGEDEKPYYNNVYNAFRSSAKYTADDAAAQGTINVKIEGSSSGMHNAVGIYSAGDAFNAYANSGADTKLEVVGNINIEDSSGTSDMTIKGIESGGATIANAYATGQNMNTDTKVVGNINIDTTSNKNGTSGSAAGIYTVKAVPQTAYIYNAALVNDKSEVEGNIVVQSSARPLSKMYGIYATNYDVNGGDESQAQPKEIYNAYYDNSTGISEGKVTGTIKVLSPLVSRTTATAEYYGIFTNGGKAYNVYSTNSDANVKGVIEVDVNGSVNNTIAAGMRGINGAYLYNTGQGENSVINVTTTKAKSKAYGMMGENSYITNDAIVNVESKADEAYGLYIKNGTAINGSNGILNVTGATGSYGIYAISTNNNDTVVQNAGRINLIGTSRNVGIYASGEKARVQNTGVIVINGSRYNNVCEGNDCESSVGIILADGAQLINGGGITSTGNIDLDQMGGSVSITNNGKFVSQGSISGNLNVEKDMVMNNFANEIILDDALEAENVSQTNVGVASYLYNTGIKSNNNGTYDIVLDMKDFSEITDNASESAYLKQNYDAEKNIELFNTLKNAPTATAAELTEARAMGTSFIPNIPEEELKIQRSLDRTMSDELFKEGADIRKIVGADAMKVGRSDSGTLTGYDINSQSTYALYDKKMNNQYRLGLGMSITHTDTDYDDDSRRKNLNIQGYVPITYKLGNNLTSVSMAHLGYSDGDYTRRSNNKSFKADTSAITYGLLNEIRYKANAGIVNVTPFVGVNALGWYQDSISEGQEAEALHVSATNVFSLESALGIYVDKDIEFNEDNRLNIALGAGYYHEFADPYRGFDTHHTDSIGKYRLKNKIHSDDRGLISAKLKYDYKAFSIYAELLQYLEEEHPTEFDGGLQYRF